MLPSLRALALALALVAGLVAAPAQAGHAEKRTKPARPEVYKVRPASGEGAGGTEVILRGKYFSRTKQVFFDRTPAAEFEVLSDKQLRVVSPPHTEGLIRIWVVTRNGRAKPGAFDGFRYVGSDAPPTPPTPPTPPSPPTPTPPLEPTVSGLSPDSGTIFGGNTVTITGTNFDAASQVMFGDTPAATVVVVSPTTITVKTPPHFLATVDVSVTTLVGTSADTGADDFQYTIF